MKKTTCFISLAIAALFVSCSSTTDDASISLSVPRELTQTVLKNSDGTDAQKYPVQKLECTLKDSSNKEIASESVELNGEKNNVITFSEIPAGTKVSVSATIYGSLTESKNEPEYRLYAGESDKITVKPGNNTITLKLEKIEDFAGISIDGIENIVLEVTYKNDTDETVTVTDEGEFFSFALPIIFFILRIVAISISNPSDFSEELLELLAILGISMFFSSNMFLNFEITSEKSSFIPSP